MKQEWTIQQIRDFVKKDYQSVAARMTKCLLSYLDESASLPSSSVTGEELKEIIAGILYKNKSDEGDEGCWINSEDFYKISDIIAKQFVPRESEAIGGDFAEWTSDNDYTYLPSKKYWVNEEREELNEKWTTLELYKIFKQYK